MLPKHSLEILEARIAPAALLPSTDDKFVPANFNGAVEVFEGQVLNTTGDANSGTYFLFMEKGNALVFFTDFNNNRQVDFNELTGISAGDGTRMVIFSDVHGDIVTNLKETKINVIGSNGLPVQTTKLTLSDSDNNAANDTGTPGDGRVLLNNTIEKIEMRSLRITDLVNQDERPGVDDLDIAARKAPSTYSIFGNIYAGKGFGAEDGGLIIDSTGGTNYGFELIPSIGSIKTGTAASGEFFSFGVSRADDKSGVLNQFVPPREQAGGDIIGVRSLDNSMKFNLNSLHAGDGGVGARGGDVRNVVITGDDSGGYEVIAGNGGDGVDGGKGGSILNFTDFGSQTSKVVIKSGDGGTGVGGVGGDGGQFGFETFNIRGDVSLTLGSGGDGFTRGGDGASLAKGNFTQPDFSTFTPANGTGVTNLGSTINWEQGSASYQARIGSTQVVDFDRDGFGDYVFTTRGTSQVVVMFGDGNGGFRSRVAADGSLEPDRYVLSGLRSPEALTVADLNGDGIMDVAVGSADAGSHAGVAVFLGQFETKDNVSTFTGFSDARFSALPQLDRTAAGLSAFWQSPHQVTSMVAGDFDGNGLPELALVLTQYSLKTDQNGITIGLGNPWQVLLFLKPDVEMDNLTNTPKLTGQFFADFGTKGPSGEPLETLLPYFEISEGTIGDSEISLSVPRIVIEASALSTTATNDAVFVGILGAGDDSEVVGTIEYGPLDFAPSVSGLFSLGQVDTDRELAEPGNAHRSPEDVTLLDFAVLDYDADGNADLLVISESPALFMVGVKGNGNGSGTQSSGNGGDNSGNFFGEDGYNLRAGSLLNVRAVDIDADGAIDDAAVHYVTEAGFDWIAGFEYQEGPLPLDAVQPDADPDPDGAILMLDIPAEVALDRTYEGPSVFGLFYAEVDDLTNPSFAVADSNFLSEIHFTQLSTLSVFSEVFNPTGLKLTAGDGGNATVGNGGKGGSLGGGSTVRTFMTFGTDANGQPIPIVVTDLVGSLNMTISGALRLEAGSGGDGFNKGGNGGDISGVTVRQRGTFLAEETFVSTSLVTGTGGRGVAGSGGNGGDIMQSSIDGFRVTMITGDGGQGNVGGDGGLVRGNGTRIYDATTSELSVTTGDGGVGASRGGSGGAIINFSPVIALLRTTELQFGSVTYLTGDGGNSVSGRGGNGGSITGATPRPNAFVDGQIIMEAGNGGSGLQGGRGGSISDFEVDLSTLSQLPASVRALAGHGGAASAGKAGDGGDIVNVKVPSRGILDGFNRLMAGNGGSSAAGAGGDGGDVRNSSTGTVEGSIAVVSGAGGHGLTQGGKGGAVNNVQLKLGGTTVFSKGLVIAGAGGDASAFIPNPNDFSLNQAEKAFGGKVGRGGNGGSINGFDQTGNQGAHVDLIAGNGGSTLNYGSIFDDKFFVGAGGSIRDVKMAGNVGNLTADLQATEGLDENVPIKSYNKVLIGETVARYVETSLRYSGDVLDDFDGNVGAVVGIAGKMKAVQLDPLGSPNVFTRLPATGSANGSLVDVRVNNIMSAVAGSVDRIAAIQVVKGLVVVSGTIGADKGSFENPMDPRIDPTPPDYETGEMNKGPGTVGASTRDYLQTDLNTLTTTGGPVLDGALIDGAIFARRILDGAGNPIKLEGRAYTVTI